MKTRLLTIMAVLSVTAILNVNAAETFVSFSRTADNQLQLTQTSDTIIYSDADWEGVKIAVRNLRNDLKAVTGSECAPIIVGTVEKSPLANKYKKQSKQLKGKWEQYLLFTDKGKLVILGSDKRGTIYGIYELSRQIGVSPWYWMADAPIPQHSELYINDGIYTHGEPKVKYRGIFINDEWPSFGGWCTNRFGGVNSKAYAKIFELLLRLKANYFWPAMWNNAFNEDDPLSPKVADDMGIVMGTSHHEPMMRAHKEYTSRRNEVGPWDYKQNPERLDKFFTEGLERNSKYENIITIGMRGDGDVAMGSGNDADNIKTLGDVIRSQRHIIKKVYGCLPEQVPQLWAIFTEVQRYYDAGFTVPDDVTLLFCDNNWGYIRRKGTETERKRKGGMGLYYHIDMNGGPWNDRWVNTTTLPKVREQLNEAYRGGLDRIWIINVGDLKPKEVPISFIMDFAWNPDAYQPGSEQPWLEQFMASIFGQEYAAETAYLISRYSKYNLWRKPEIQVPGLMNAREMAITQQRWQEIELRAERLRSQLPDNMQDAYYQLVYYPVMASAGVAKIYNAATLKDTLSIDVLMEKDRELTTYYNTGIAGGKWNGMMQDKHIGYTRWEMPRQDTNPLRLREYSRIVSGFELDGGQTDEIAIPAYNYTNLTAGKNASWIFLPDLGRGKGCIGSSDVMASESGAALEYVFELPESKDQATIALAILPTQDIYPARGLRLGIQIDDNPVITIDARQGLHDEFKEYTPQNLAISKVLKARPEEPHLALNGWIGNRKMMRRTEVFDNIRWITAETPIKEGKHTLRVIMIDPEVVLEQIVINPDNSHYSYFGGGVEL
jgi:hypothetical protein